MPWAVLDLHRSAEEQELLAGLEGRSSLPRRGGRAQRDSFLTSLGVHLLLGVALIGVGGIVARPPAPSSPSPGAASSVRHVFLPPPAALRRLADTAPRPAVRRDRISVGAPSVVRQRGPLELRPEDDLTRVAHGRPDVVPSPPPPAPEPAASSQPATPPEPSRAVSSLGMRSLRPSLLASARAVVDRLAPSGAVGLESGTGQQIGPLFFDPQGADFTAWLNHFKDEVYRNWVIPQAALMGFGGEVGFEFTVERDGAMSAIRQLSASGTPALDRAAHNALAGSRLLPLPADFAPPRLTFKVIFIYGRPPAHS